MATIAMWILICLLIFSIVIIFIGVRNSVVSGREEEMIKNRGKETTALITHTEQNKNQSIEGVLHLNLTLEFSADNQVRVTQREVFVRMLHLDEFRAGKSVKIRYLAEEPTKLVVLGNCIN
jgi:uncharacterized protein YpmS